jgi:hypothetical protein
MCNYRAHILADLLDSNPRRETPGAYWIAVFEYRHPSSATARPTTAEYVLTTQVLVESSQWKTVRGFNDPLHPRDCLVFFAMLQNCTNTCSKIWIDTFTKVLFPYNRVFARVNKSLLSPCTPQGRRRLCGCAPDIWPLRVRVTAAARTAPRQLGS